MGWAVLYIAFGVVALWLLGEVLLQYKARLRWRLLAFGGFLLVVFGVVMPSVAVIALGTVAFATGQTFVTLSFRRGFSTGWALGGKPGTSKRRRGLMRPMEPLPDADGDIPPVPDETPAEGVPQAVDGRGYDDGYDEAESTRLQPAATGGEQHGGSGEQGEEIYTTVEGAFQDPYLGVYDPASSDWTEQPATVYAPHDQGDNFAAYPDPYLEGAAPAHQAYPDYQEHQQAAQDPYTPDYGAQDSGQWQTTGQYYQETPPGGVWVPQQRDDESAGYGYPQPEGQDGYPPATGYDPTSQGHYYNNDGRY